VQITASIAAGPTGTLQNATATTDAGGRATFSGLTLTGVVGNYTISFSAQGLGGVMSNPIALSAGPATQLAFAVAPPATARSRAPLGPVIQLQDVSGNPVAQAGISIVASVDAGTLTGLSTVSTGTDGRAAFTDLAIAGSPGQKTLTFSSTSPPLQAASAQVTLPDVARIRLHPQVPTSAVVGTLTNAPFGILEDVAGKPVPDAPFTLSVSAGTLTSANGASDANGAVLVTWTLGTIAGKQTVDIKVSEAVPSLVVDVQATADAPAQLQKISGDNPVQTAPADSALDNPFVVRVTDQYGNGVSGVTVQWRGCDGSGTYNPMTDPEGYSSARQRTGSQQGPACAKAFSPGVDLPQLAGSPITFDYIVGPPAPSALRGSAAVKRVMPAHIPPEQPLVRRPPSR
jgi:hypothetical protein